MNSKKISLEGKDEIKEVAAPIRRDLTPRPAATNFDTLPLELRKIIVELSDNPTRQMLALASHSVREVCCIVDSKSLRATGIYVGQLFRMVYPGEWVTQKSPIIGGRDSSRPFYELLEGFKSGASPLYTFDAPWNEEFISQKEYKLRLEWICSKGNVSTETAVAMYETARNNYASIQEAHDDQQQAWADGRNSGEPLSDRYEKLRENQIEIILSDLYENMKKSLDGGEVEEFGVDGYNQWGLDDYGQLRSKDLLEHLSKTGEGDLSSKTMSSEWACENEVDSEAYLEGPGKWTKRGGLIEYNNQEVFFGQLQGKGRGGR